MLEEFYIEPFAPGRIQWFGVDLMNIADLDTPSVVVDLDVLERNVRHMAERAGETGVRLRPHAKTHKIPEVARLQLAAEDACRLSTAPCDPQSRAPFAHHAPRRTIVPANGPAVMVCRGSGSNQPRR